MDTSTQIYKKKRHIQALLLILWSGTFRVVFITHTDCGELENCRSWCTTQLKHNTLVKHSASLRDKICRDLYSNENATLLLAAFRRQEAVNQCAEEAKLILKFNTAFFIAKEELPFTKYKGQLNLQRKNSVKLNSTYNLIIIHILCIYMHVHSHYN